MKALTFPRSSTGSQVEYPECVRLSWLCSAHKQGAGSCVWVSFTCFGSGREREECPGTEEQTWVPTRCSLLLPAVLILHFLGRLLEFSGMLLQDFPPNSFHEGSSSAEQGWMVPVVGQCGCHAGCALCMWLICQVPQGG